MAYRCVCFDFDGTLADTEGMVFRIYNELAKKYHYAPIDASRREQIKEMSAQEILRHLDLPLYQLFRLLHEGRKHMSRRQEEIVAIQENLPAYFRTLSETVDYCGVLTSNSADTVRDFLWTHKLSPYIDFVEGGAMFSKRRKLLKLCRKLRISASQMLYVGDETRDVRACREAGIDIAAVDWGYNTKAALARCHPTYEVSEFSELIEIVQYHNSHREAGTKKVRRYLQKMKKKQHQAANGKPRQNDKKFS
ncbi:MAG: HAD hydrolase-like protein [Pseudoramibacter sp.]